MNISLWYNIRMKDFIISKMELSTFDSNEVMLDFLEYDYKILGDTDSFIVYYYLADNVIWVHFLWAKSKKKMLKICRTLWAESQATDSIILFDCDEYESMFGNHARKLYVWDKEI